MQAAYEVAKVATKKTTIAAGMTLATVAVVSNPKARIAAAKKTAAT